MTNRPNLPLRERLGQSRDTCRQTFGQFWVVLDSFKEDLTSTQGFDSFKEYLLGEAAAPEARCPGRKLSFGTRRILLWASIRFAGFLGAKRGTVRVALASLAHNRYHLEASRSGTIYGSVPSNLLTDNESCQSQPVVEGFHCFQFGWPHPCEQ